MLSQEFMRNALLAGTFVALACGVVGWFVVLRGQVFAGDALSHVAFPGALAAAAVGVDQRVGLFAATVAVGLAIGALGRGALAGGAQGSPPSDDTAIGTVFTFVLGLGVFFLARVSMSSSGSSGVVGAHTLFGSIFGLTAGEARLAAAIAAGGDGPYRGDRQAAAVRVDCAGGRGGTRRAHARAGDRLRRAARGRRRGGDAGRRGAAAARVCSLPRPPRRTASQAGRSRR